MDKRFTVFGFLSQVFMMYGITTALLNIFCILFGNTAAAYSSIFSLAGNGISITTSFQFLFAMILIMLLHMIFMTDIFIRKMPLAARITGMFVSVFAVMIGFVLLFDWFPKGDPVAWVMFVLCFTVSCAVSVTISSIAERQENHLLEEALKRVKEEQ